MKRRVAIAAACVAALVSIVVALLVWNIPRFRYKAALEAWPYDVWGGADIYAGCIVEYSDSNTYRVFRGDKHIGWLNAGWVKYKWAFQFRLYERQEELPNAMDTYVAEKYGPGYTWEQVSLREFNIIYGNNVVDVCYSTWTEDGYVINKFNYFHSGLSLYDTSAG